MGIGIKNKPILWHLIRWGLLCLCFCLVTTLSVMGLEWDLLVFPIWSGGNVIFLIDFRPLPMMAFAALYGYVPAFISSFWIFLIEFFLRPSGSYAAAVYLMAAVLFAAAGQKQIFRSRKKTWIFFVAAMILMGGINVMVSMLMQYDFNLCGILYLWVYALEVLPSCLAGCFLGRRFFTKTPDRVKSLVFLGALYFDQEMATEENREMASHRNVISTRITGIVMAEAMILVISSMLFSTLLLPDLVQMTELTAEGETSVDWLKNLDWRMRHHRLETDRESGGAEDGAEEPIDVDFVGNAYGLAYLGKLALMLFCVSIPVASFVDLFVKMWMVGPITRISGYMVRFARTPQSRLRDYAEEVKDLHIRTRDEIEELYHAVDRTVHDMVHYIDRVRHEQELKEDLRVAEAASKAKSEFLSNMSHEIRTPINAVLGLDEMILRESREEEIRRYATDIQSAGSTLLALINDILDSSKIESGKMEILPVQYELASTINDLVNMISTKAKDKDLELIVHVDETTPRLLFGDEIRVKQCILNVLTNAVKYTEKGSVTMEIGWIPYDPAHPLDLDGSGGEGEVSEGGTAEITEEIRPEESGAEKIYLTARVADTGIGIKEEDIGKLFSPFERIEEIRNRSVEGTGLGMSIVKKLLAMMGTKLVVKSVYGEGSDFSFSVLQEVVDKDPIGDFEESYRKSLESQEEYHALFTAPEAKILVVDDTKMNLTVVKGLLKETEVQVVTAESGAETLEKVTEERYDLILLDHRMPEMDGLETREAMETLEGNLNPDTPVIALTANAVAGAREIYMDAGFVDYLSKPIDSVKLEKTLLRYLPREKCHLAGEEGYTSREREADLSPEEDTGGTDHQILSSLQGIDLAEAVGNCGSEEVLLSAVRDFLAVLPEKADQIEGFAAEGDFRNYTVLVHALKSSARIIGAAELSEQAAHLEQCGLNEEREEIEEKTPALLTLYRSYLEKLSPAAKEAPGGEEADDRPVLTEAEWAEAASGIRECAEAFDLVSAESIFDMLSAYRVEPPLREKYEEVGKLVHAVDREGLLKAL